MAKKATTKVEEVKVEAKVEKPKTTRTRVKKPELAELLKEIEVRSYELFQERTATGVQGCDLDDWLVAEKEVKAKYKIK